MTVALQNQSNGENHNNGEKMTQKPQVHMPKTEAPNPFHRMKESPVNTKLSFTAQGSQQVSSIMATSPCFLLTLLASLPYGSPWRKQMSSS
jgi:hypothetical protein